MLQEIAIKQCRGLFVPTPNGEPADRSLSFVSKMMQYGFMPKNDLADALSNADLETITSLEEEVIPILKKSVGAHVLHKALYVNFPNDNTSNAGSYMNDMISVMLTGTGNDNFTARPSGYEDVKFKMLGRSTNADIDKVFTDILASADSISESNKKIVKWFIDSNRATQIPKEIPFKENMCLVAGILLEKGAWADGMVKSANDILRIATYISGGDISLAENTKFKNLPRSKRKRLIFALEAVAKEEDFVKHSGKWVKLFHSLHVGDYSKKLYAIAQKFRENEKVRTFEGKLEVAIGNNNWDNVIKMLVTRPGIYARTIGRLLTDRHVTENTGAFAELASLKETTDVPKWEIVNSFKTVIDKVPTRNLTQLWGSLKTRHKEVSKRVVFPKGSVANAYVLRNKLARIPTEYLTDLIVTIELTLQKRFSKGDSLGKVWIDPALNDCPLPTGMRSASEGLREVARGTRMDIGNKEALRFFIYWKGQDIDLSASFHDENFNMVAQVTYYDHSDGYYSGDETSAPNGASEFIDVPITASMEKHGARYVVMNVHVYSGPTFAEHEECFAGWMTRDEVNNSEIFDPKTVQHKIDLRSDTKTAIPVIFDLKERKAIWADVNATGRAFNRRQEVMANNVENNKATISDMCEAFTSLDNKVSLFELFDLHTQARGELVTDIKEADTVFAMDPDIGTEDANVITPFDIIKINGSFLM